MFWKDQLAREILDQTSITHQWLVGLQNDYPALRVKTVDAQGKVPVIQLSGKGEWMKPKEWAVNHIAHLKQQHEELLLRLKDVGSDPIIAQKLKATIASLESEREKDLLEHQTLQQEYAKLRRSHGILWKCLRKFRQGEDLSDYLLAVIDESVQTQKDYILIRS